MKIHIEKHNTRNVWSGTIPFESYYTNDEGVQFSLTFKQTKEDGESSSFSVLWDTLVPFEKEKEQHPYTTKGSAADKERIRIEEEITKEFIRMPVNVFFE